MKKQPNPQSGLIGWIILIIVAIAVLSYFGFNFQTFFSSPTVHQNFVYVWNSVLYVWNNFLAVPATFVWNFIYKFVIQPLINLAMQHAAGQ